MNEWSVVVVLIAVAGLVATLATPMIRLNTTMTRLVVLVEELSDKLGALERENDGAHERLAGRVDALLGEVHGHETRLTVLEMGGKRVATYDPGIDYSDLIAQEAAKGVNADRQLLAQYEAQRNAKIAGERLPYAQTAVYTSELGRPLGYYGAEDRSDYINEIYDQARELSVAALESAYEREMAGYDYAAAQIPDRYRAAKNALGADAARARQSINEQFAASGLNTGAAGQARLSMAVAGQGRSRSLTRTGRRPSASWSCSAPGRCRSTAARWRRP